MVYRKELKETYAFVVFKHPVKDVCQPKQVTLSKISEVLHRK